MTDRAHLHDHAAERGLIGTVFDAPETFYDAQAAGITSQSFTLPTCWKVWQAFCDLSTARKPLNRYHVLQAVTTFADGEGLHLFDDVSAGKAYMAAFVRDVQAKESARKLRRCGQGLIERVERGDAPEAIMAAAHADLSETGAAGVKIKTMRDVRPEKVAQWKAAMGRGFIDIQTAWPELDEILGGHRRKMVNVLGAYRGSGKSTLARQMLSAVAMRGTPVGLLSMEDPAEVAAAGIAGSMGNFSVYHLDTGRSDVTPDEAGEAWERVDKLPIYIVDAPMTIVGVLNAMRMLVARHGVQMVAVDHIQYILPSQKHGSRNEEIMRYSAEIVAATKQLDIHTLVVSQLSRDCEKEARRPRLSDLRDSGAIEQDARAVMLLSQMDTGDFELEVAKNNNGPRGSLKLRRVDGRQRFECLGKM